jgi:transposase
MRVLVCGGRDFADSALLYGVLIATILGKISKRGNRYLRVLFVQAAWVVLIKPMSWERHGLRSYAVAIGLVRTLGMLVARIPRAKKTEPA